MSKDDLQELMEVFEPSVATPDSKAGVLKLWVITPKGVMSYFLGVMEGPIVYLLMF